MTTTPKPEPASDADLAVVRPLGYRCIGCVLGTPPETHGSACIFAMEPRLLARIEVDRATIAKQAEEIERLRSALINLRAKCLEMGWGPEAPQLLDASAALSKPEPGR